MAKFFEGEPKMLSLLETLTEFYASVGNTADPILKPIYDTLYNYMHNIYEEEGSLPDDNNIKYQYQNKLQLELFSKKDFQPTEKGQKKQYESPFIEIKQIDASKDLMSQENENNTEENRTIIEKIVKAAVQAVYKFKNKEIRAKQALKRANKEYGTSFQIKFDSEYNPSIPSKEFTVKKEIRNKSYAKTVEQSDKFSQYKLHGKESFSELIRMQNDDPDLYREYLDIMGQDIEDKCNQ